MAAPVHLPCDPDTSIRTHVGPDLDSKKNVAEHKTADDSAMVSEAADLKGIGSCAFMRHY